MKKLFFIGFLALILAGCEEIIPEYTPYFDEPKTESIIPIRELPSIADDGTVWYVSDRTNKVYWLKDGVIKSLPKYSEYYWADGYLTLGNDFYYFSRDFLLKHNYDSVTVFETPFSTNPNLKNDYSLRATSNNILLLSSYHRVYYVLTDAGWQQKSVPTSITNYSFDLKKYSRGNWVLSPDDHKIYNILTQEVASFASTFPDYWGSNVTPTFDRQCFDQDGNAYGLAGGRLIRRNLATQTTEGIDVNIPGIDEPYIKLVRVSENNEIWVLFSHYNSYFLCAHKIGTNSFTETEMYKDDYSFPSTSLAGSNGLFWVSYNNTIYAYNASGQLLNRGFPFFDNSDDIFREDKSGAMWFGTLLSWNQPYIYKYKNGVWTDMSGFFVYKN